MAVPKYDEMMLPILKMLAQSGTTEAIPNKSIYQHIVSYYALSQEDLSDRSDSGTLRYKDNASWALTYMRQAGLIASPKKGLQQITPRGIEVAESNITKIDKDYLMLFDEFQAFLNRKNTKKSGAQEEKTYPSVFLDKDRTPTQAIEKAYEDINSALAGDLIDEIMQQPPYFFEKLVVDLLLAMGYGDNKAESGFVTKQSNDDGIDGIIREDKLGFSNIYIQAKRWNPSSNIGRPEIQKFAGALMGSGATKGLFISTTGFTNEAIDFANRQLQTKIILVDGHELAQLMIAHNVGVSLKYAYEIKAIDKDYFDYAI